MRSRATLATLAVGALAVSGLFGHGSGSPEPSARATPTHAAGQQPNILLITADDLAVGDLDHMPNVRKLLGQHGVTFEDGLAPTPLCVPARASLLTGQYAHNHDAHSIEGPYGGYDSFDNNGTVATALQEAGYQTLFAGKYLNGYGKDRSTREAFPPGWNQWRATVDPSTYKFFDQLMNINGTLERQHGYTTDVMTQQSETEIRTATKERKKNGKPWFAWVNYVAPHVGGPAGADDPSKLYAGTDAAYKTTVPDLRDRNVYRDVKLPAPPNMFQEDTSGFPANSPKQRRFNPLQKKSLALVHRRRLEAALGLDRAVGQQIALLRKTRQLAKTLVIFTSDNGFAVGQHNLQGKLWHYNEIVSIPVLMRGPGIPDGTTTSTPITNPDIAATILTVAHATPPRPLDGVDIRPWLDKPYLRVIPTQAWPVVDGTRRLYFGVRAGTWTYAKLRGGGEELFNRYSDPYELDNLANDPGNRRALVRLRDLAKRFRTCAADTCPKQFYRLYSADQLPPADAS